MTSTTKPSLKRTVAVIGPVPAAVPAKKAKVFRHDAKRSFHTYPQCNLTCQYVMDYFLNTIFEGREGTRVRACEEKHNNGDPHVHAIAKVTKKFATRNPRWADIVGPDGTVFHGRYEPVRSWAAACKYVCKGDDPVFVDNFPEGEEEVNTTSVWEELITIAKASGLRKAMDHLVTNHPEEFVRRGDQIRRNLALVSAPSKAVIPDHFRFKANPPFIDEWLAGACNKALWMKGASGLGKTAKAIELLTIDGQSPLIVSSLDATLMYDPQIHSGILFDDFSPKAIGMSEQQCIHLLCNEYDRSVKARYKDAIIPKGTKKIFCSNVSIWPTASVQLSRRMKYWHVVTDLRDIDPGSNIDQADSANEPPLEAFMDFPINTGFIHVD